MAILEDLQSKVGTEIGVGEWVTISQHQIDQFAAATGDRQWIHVDPERAASGPFGTTIAHGYLTLALLPAIVVPLDLPEARHAVNYGLDRVRFISPVPVDSRVRARSRLIEVHAVPGGIHVKLEVTVELEGEERPACVAETISLFIF